MASVLVQGYGITLGTINALSVLISVFEAIPSLGLQVTTSRFNTMSQYATHQSKRLTVELCE